MPETDCRKLSGKCLDQVDALFAQLGGVGKHKIIIDRLAKFVCGWLDDAQTHIYVQRLLTPPLVRVDADVGRDAHVTDKYFLKVCHHPSHRASASARKG